MSHASPGVLAVGSCFHLIMTPVHLPYSGSTQADALISDEMFLAFNCLTPWASDEFTLCEVTLSEYGSREEIASKGGQMLLSSLD